MRQAATCWVISDGRAGIEVQARGLAEALGFDPVIKRIKTRAPWRWLPPQFWLDPLRAVDPAGDPLAPPWPDVAIGSGRQAVAPNRAIRRASRGRSFVIQVQDPKVDLAGFDVVVAPEHDRLAGPNLIATKGSLHGVTEARLAAAAAEFAPRFEALPRPLVGVLVGGNSRKHRMTADLAQALGDGLAQACRAQDVGLAVTPSRRTGPANEAILRRALAPVAADVWDWTGPNPYFGILALADAFVVTGDSVNMVCEAAFTGRPVHVFETAGGTAKFRRFHDTMRAAGITRPFAGRVEEWSYPPLRETPAVAAEIRRRLDARGSPAAAG